mmetsp:Transcript_18660/g.33703  ORF Transcript_18660/g.33703 Transcript_18660/m.33703 type:complete len:231 (-) Transcript_18660:100-792(-)
MVFQATGGESSGEDEVERTFDKDVLAQSIEELTLHSEIRAIEIQTGLDGLRRQMEMQELLVQQWQEEFRKERKNLPAEFAAQLQAAQESVMALRQQCKKLEEERPLPPPAAPSSNEARAREEPVVAQQQTPQHEVAAPPAAAKVTEKVPPQKKGAPWMPPVQKSRVPLPKAPAASSPADAPGGNLVELARRSAARASSGRQRSGSATRGSGYPTSGADADTEGTPRRRAM